MIETPYNLFEAEIVDISFESSIAEAVIRLREVWEKVNVKIVLSGVKLLSLADCYDQNIVEEIIVCELSTVWDREDGSSRVSTWGNEQVEAYERLSGARSPPKYILEVKPILGASVLVLFEDYKVESDP